MNINLCACTGACRVPPYRCPLGLQPWPPVYWPPLPTPPMGCICPPTSEQTCENPVCPRRNPLRGITSTTAVQP